MKTSWDYTELAEAYLKRPDYSIVAINAVLDAAGIVKEMKVCDVGAGVAHLTLVLAKKGLEVCAVEPNDAMRERGMKRTRKLKNVEWFEGTGENTGQNANSFDLVTFGSSFNVTDRAKALLETARILKPGGWFACMWNHRDLDDPVQKEIENIISNSLGSYNYGTRREDQTKVINESGLFGKVEFAEGEVVHKQKIDDILEAWRSHATLARQAKEKFSEIIGEIEKYLKGLRKQVLSIPYKTRIWYSRLQNQKESFQ